MRRHPEDEVLSLSRVKTKLAEITGVVSILHHMCINTCIAYTGPFSELETCPKCHEPRFDQLVLLSSGGKTKTPRLEFHTIPIGPQLQALWRSPEGVKNIQHRARRTDEIITALVRDNGKVSSYDDFYHGSEYLTAVDEEDIKTNDMVLMLSIDGAQLYQSKASDCWIYIWVVLDLPPHLRYKKKHVLPGGFIPGPNKPKNLDSFLFPGLQHLAALSKEGLSIWNSKEEKTFLSYPFLALATADGPGMACLNGLCGHQGAHGCRFYCGWKGRRKSGRSQYYPALLKPDNYTVSGSDHNDYDVMSIPTTSSDEYYQNLQYVENSSNKKEFEERRKNTGISKPSLFSGLPPKHIMALPRCFGGDMMHLGSLNITDLLTKLWRGVLDCDSTDDRSTWDWAVLKGDVWKSHGETVAKATPYLPGSFDRPPRNPAEKISSGYKAWEFLMYVFGFCPALLRGILPEKYWANFCKLACGLRILHQRTIPSAQLSTAHKMITEFVREFEELYYQRRPDRLHFIRPCVHTILHLAAEVPRLGPPSIYTQWTMERTIGNLGEEIKQHSNPFANLSQRGVLRCQINALKSMFPELEPNTSALPRGSYDAGDEYILLRALDSSARYAKDAESLAIASWLTEIGEKCQLVEGYRARIARWARLRLPNGQIARSAWREKQKPLNKVRMARNVKVSGK